MSGETKYCCCLGYVRSGLRLNLNHGGKLLFLLFLVNFCTYGSFYFCGSLQSLWLGILVGSFMVEEKEVQVGVFGILVSIFVEYVIEL